MGYQQCCHAYQCCPHIRIFYIHELNNMNNSQEQQIIQVSENAMSLDEFRIVVKKWLEIDDIIKQANTLIREKRKQRDAMQRIIVSYMTRYSIEDLHTTNDRIRCRAVQTKPPVSHKYVKQRIVELEQNRGEQLVNEIYNTTDKVEKIRLRRLKIT